MALAADLGAQLHDALGLLRRLVLDLVDVGRRQHERGRQLTDGILQGAASAASPELAALLRSFSAMYRPHAAREDTVLFPAFRELLARVSEATAAAYAHKDLPFEQAALVACGVTTGLASSVYAAGTRAGETVVVIGIGGVAGTSSHGAPLARLAASRSQALEPGRHVHLVISLFTPDLGDQLAQRGEGGVRQRVEPDPVCRVIQVAPGDRSGPVAARMVEQPRVVVTLDWPVVGDGIGVAAVIDDVRQQPVQRLGMAQLVLGERAHRDVLFEHRRDPRPLRVAPAEHELVVNLSRILFPTVVLLGLSGIVVAILNSYDEFTVPALAYFGILVAIVGLGWTSAITVLTIYALLPIVRNTVTGLREVDPAIVKAATGMGMGRLARLWRIELPLAYPVILSGIRVSTVLIVGITAIAAYVAGPGLGAEMFSALGAIGSVRAIPQLIVATGAIILIALVLDAVPALIGRITTPRGLR